MNQNIFCSKCHRVPSQCCCLSAKELTEWEIKECWEEATEMREHFCSQYFDFAQLILKKAREK
jgi:hypothetical protein